MFLNVGNKWFCWLAALALWPAVVWGEIIKPLRNQTVCTGKRAFFISEVEGIFTVTGWRINGVLWNHLSPEEKELIPEEVVVENVPGMTWVETLTINYHKAFNGLKVELVAINDEVVVNRTDTTTAYLFYQPNHQSPATGLTYIISNTTAQIYWNELVSNFTIQYLFGVYDSDNALIANQTTSTTQISYNLPPRADDTCQYLTFRVTAEQCPDPDRGFNQTESAALAYTSPNVSPVTAKFDNSQKVLINWTPDGDSAFQIVITDLASGEQSTYNGIPPFSYTPPACGQHSLNVSVSPAQCAGESGFTHTASIGFTIPCPTTPTTETETEITGESSGTQANYPSLLLTVAAVIPLLKWLH